MRTRSGFPSCSTMMAPQIRGGTPGGGRRWTASPAQNCPKVDGATLSHQAAENRRSAGREQAGYLRGGAGGATAPAEASRESTLGDWMVRGVPGLDVSSLVRGVLAEDRSIGARGMRGSTRLTDRLAAMMDPVVVDPHRHQASADPYDRLFSTETGRRAADLVGNESRTLDALSALSIEILLEYLDERWAFSSGPSSFGRRFLNVPGAPADVPTLLVLDPAIADVSQSRRLTEEVDLDPLGLVAAFDCLRPLLKSQSDVGPLLSASSSFAAVELFWIVQPEIVLTRRPRMVPLSAPSPHVQIMRASELSSVGVFCRDAAGELGVSGCFHGTGPVGTAVTVGGVPSTVKHADAVQDIVFIPLGPAHPIPAVYGLKGPRQTRAPSEAEAVRFDGAGSQVMTITHVKSHDAGILRKRATLQLKLQTPADTNSGDSGSALVDSDDHVVGFGFERTGIGEFPELTDWIWADNALASLGLTPV